MADRAEIKAIVQEALKDHMDALYERVVDAVVSRMMDKMMTIFTARQQQPSLTPQPVIPSSPRPAGNPDKAPKQVPNPTLPLESVILTGTGFVAPRMIQAPHTSAAAGGLNDEFAKLLAKLEQRLRIIEGTRGLASIDLSMYTKLQVPDEFETPDFEKYDGTSNPIQHVQMYHARMIKYVTNGPLMVLTFPASLKDAAMRWYTDYNINHMENWEEAAIAFVEHFRFNI